MNETMLSVLLSGLGLTLVGSLLVIGVLMRHQGLKKGRFVLVMFSKESPIHAPENRWDVRRLIAGFFITSIGAVTIGTHFLILDNERQADCNAKCAESGYSVGLPGPSAVHFNSDDKPLPACWCKSDKNKTLIELE